MAMVYSVQRKAISSKNFTYDGKTQMFIAEISDFLSMLRNTPDLLNQAVYDDACDVGFAIRSVKTGRVVTFALTKTEYLGGEIIHWDYAVIPEDARKDNNKLAKVTVRIFND